MQKFPASSQPRLAMAASERGRGRPGTRPMTELSPGDRRYDNIGYFSWAAAKDRPDDLAIIDLSRDPPVEITYRRLEEHVGKFRDFLAEHGEPPEEQELIAAKLMGRWRSGGWPLRRSSSGPYRANSGSSARTTGRWR